jgi:hypothetical protein
VQRDQDAQLRRGSDQREHTEGANHLQAATLLP